ncbi:hypothetical protein EPUS_00283 [Endocarpon pusillum Z07020]|uniref:Palmitoyltransferase n=1 Tax=Endocarpon pusillum (strain Z07020 / HMAS-L-300199) TaxID=1263415 RepID=U1GEF1_ENDPU|nr:uncharacterized protein EPUS_00283 [Endocarpon pusillum Z07020]ERF70096.1 hypothetical protein EPUS_00283 [Endocarpon pusillum Z07020]
MAARHHKALNKWVARLIPGILLGLIGYSAYVITKVIAIDYLITPSPGLPIQRRPGSAAGILLFYYLLLIPLLICYTRLIQTIITNPGYVPRGAEWYQQRKEEAAGARRKHRRGYQSQRRSLPHDTEKPPQQPQPWRVDTQDLESGGSNHSSLTTHKKHANHFSHSHNNSTDIPFWQRDIFVCNPDGRPPFCSSCLTHKPDRTHHCSEVDRCVLKMDHFCPWVGGIVSETSFKYFIQFNVYAAFFCIMVLTTISVFIAERRRIDPGFLNVHYFLLLGISALFTLFSLGMAGSSIQLSLINSTTVENLNRRSKVWFLAVLIPRNEDGTLPSLPPPQSSKPGVGGFRPTPRFQTITYPRPPEEEQFLIHQARSQQGHSRNLPPADPSSTINTRPSTTPPTLPSQQPRTFAILSTQPGENPFDIGPWENIRQVMGYSLSEWLFPIRQSPCGEHRGRVSAFKINKELVRRLTEEAGFMGVRRERDSRSRSGGESGMGSGSGDGSGSAAEDFGSRRKKRRRRRSRQASRRDEGEEGVR